MKIGLLTWHHVENYGTAYQAFALYHILRAMGVEVDLINYKRNKSYYPQRYSYNRFSVFHHDKKNNIYKLKSETFNKFYEKYFTYSKSCKYRQDFQIVNNEYDCFVCGSDQIWNPHCFDGHFFLDFVDESRRKIAYAPSFGVNRIENNDLRKQIGNLINLFDFLSVRENSGCTLASSMTGRKDVFNAVDPVFLLDRNEWNTISKRPSKFDYENYAFIFFLANSSNIKLCIDEVRNLGLKPIIYHCTQTADNEFANIDELSPEEMLYVLENASYVCTDSYHIMAFSIIFNKKIKVFKKQTNNRNDQYERISQLVDYFELYDSEYETNKCFEISCAYNSVDKLITNWKEKSIEYLKKAIFSQTVYQVKDNIEKCPYKLNNVEKNCSGKNTEYVQEEKERRINFFVKHIFKIIIVNGLCLEEKCYGCKYLELNTTDFTYQKPVFYNELMNSLYNKKWVKVYMNYCLYYDIKKIFRRSIK